MNLKTTALVFVLALMVGCATAQLEVSESSWIIDDVVKARGGEQAIEAIQTVRTQLEITEKDTTVHGDYRASRDGFVRIDIYADDKLVYSEGIDADGAWERNGDMSAKAVSVTGAPEDNLRHGLIFNLYGLHELHDLGHSVRLDGWDDEGGQTYQVLKITLADGFETWRYIDPATHLVVKSRDERALHPMADPDTKLLERDYSEFATSCGVVSPMASRQIDVTSGETLQTTKVLSQTCNLPNDQLAFSRGAPPIVSNQG